MTHPMTPDLTSKRVMKKRGRVNEEQETGHKDTKRQFRAQPMPDFTAVKVSVVEWYNMHVTCITSDFKAVKVSVVEWYNMHVTCITSDFKTVKVSVVEWYNMHVKCQTSRK